jgi:predicted lipid-binding transport protein (Tim44 family)
MKRHTYKALALVAAVMFLSMVALELTAQARVGGGRSYGSSGSRSYSRPAAPYSQSGPSRQTYTPAPSPVQQGGGGGFMRSMAGGMAGGMLGSMLFGGSAGAGGMGSGAGSGGIGFFQIILLAGGGYLLYRFLRGKSN